MRKRFPHAGAPVVRNNREPHDKWSDARDARLKVLCLTTESYGTITRMLNEEFKDEPKKTRNATLGRASRKGYCKDKPSIKGERIVRKRKIKYAGADTRKRVKSRLEVVLSDQPVTFTGEEEQLRDEGDRAIGPRRSRKLKEGDVALDQRRKGNLPSIIEQAPLTSVPVTETERGCCMWPTNDDATEVCGAEAKVGAYCARHAQVAFRVMPTRKRNRIRGKEDREHLIRVDGSHLRSEADPDGEWLSRQLMALDEVTVSTEDDGIAPLMLPHFIGAFNE